MNDILIAKYIDSIIKIKAFNNNNEMIKFFTGSFYDKSYFQHNSRNIFFNNNNSVYVITSKHCIDDEEIAKLELSFYNNQKLQNYIIKLNEYDVIDVPNCDLVVIHIRKNMSCNFLSQTRRDMVYENTDMSHYSSLLNCCVQILGYYDENIEPCILEFGNIVSPYNEYKFYIKSKNIVEGYSGAPVFIEVTNNYGRSLCLVGYVSQYVENDNVEIVSAENLILVDEVLKRNY